MENQYFDTQDGKRFTPCAAMATQCGLARDARTIL
jgi:hypothetical protein